MLSLIFGMNNKYFFLKKIIANMKVVVIHTVGVYPDNLGSFFPHKCLLSSDHGINVENPSGDDNGHH